MGCKAERPPSHCRGGRPDGIAAFFEMSPRARKLAPRIRTQQGTVDSLGGQDVSRLDARLPAGPRGLAEATGIGLTWPRVAAAAVLVIYIAIQFRWVWLYRHGGLLDIDEAGYLAIALKEFFALRDGGWLAWIAAIEAPRQEAPMTTALASLLFAAFGPHLILGFAVPVVAMVVTIVATYFLGRSLKGRSAGWLSAVLVATAPLLVNFSRDFQFSVVATAISTLALLALVRSEQMSKWGAVIAFGVLVGLMPLARTVTIAFVPGMLVAAAVLALSAPDKRAERLARVAVSGVVATGVAALWLGFNGAVVLDYLLGSGYGARAAEYGQLQGLAQSLSFRVGRLLRGLYFPNAVVVTIGLLLGLTAIFAAILRSPKKRASLAILIRSPLVSLFIFAALGLVALASSQNVGAAFEAPLIPAICTLSICGWLAIPTRYLRGWVVRSVVPLAALVTFVPLIDLGWPLARPLFVTMPYLGPTTITNGMGIQQLYETSRGLNDQNPGGPLPAEVAQNWWGLYERTAAKISAAAGDHLVAYGMRGVMYNINNVNLAQLLMSGRTTAGTQISPLETGTSVAGYQAWLTSGRAADACVLLTSEGTEGELAPPPDVPNLQQAARLSGFVVKDNWPTPSGRTVEMWVRHPCD